MLENRTRSLQSSDTASQKTLLPARTLVSIMDKKQTINFGAGPAKLSQTVSRLCFARITCYSYIRLEVNALLCASIYCRTSVHRLPVYLLVSNAWRECSRNRVFRQLRNSLVTIVKTLSQVVAFLWEMSSYYYFKFLTKDKNIA